jgi:hypothetical protein
MTPVVDKGISGAGKRYYSNNVSPPKGEKDDNFILM